MNLSEIFSPKEILRVLYPHTYSWEFTDNGVIGEKMSYNAPEVQWDALKAAGITQIIDVRYKYNPKKFEEQCRIHGINYYYYPVHNDPETIKGMVKNYSRFTELLIDGGYFMMGRTHGLIAFAIYLSFSKKHGLYPMKLRSSLKNDKRIMEKAIPIMRAMAKEWGIEYGLEWGDRITNEKEKDISNFTQQEYPEKLSLSFVNFTRNHRNGDVVYDISVDGIGRVGYLYPKDVTFWGYDIVMYPNGRSESGVSHSFEQAQQKIIRFLCSELPSSVKYVALPPSMKMCIQLMRKQLNC